MLEVKLFSIETDIMRWWTFFSQIEMLKRSLEDNFHFFNKSML